LMNPLIEQQDFGLSLLNQGISTETQREALIRG